MALDFHIIGSHQHLFAIEENDYSLLVDIFEKYYHYTGVYIAPYDDGRLYEGNLKTLVKIIDDYVKITNLNQNKAKTTAILSFRGKLEFCIDNQWDLAILGD